MEIDQSSDSNKDEILCSASKSNHEEEKISNNHVNMIMI